MAANHENTTTNIANAATAGAESGSHSNKIDRTAPAGSANSLGSESVRDGRPNTDDGTVEAIDEEGPGITPPLATDKTSNNR